MTCILLIGFDKQSYCTTKGERADNIKYDYVSELSYADEKESNLLTFLKKNKPKSIISECLYIQVLLRLQPSWSTLISALNIFLMLSQPFMSL